MNSVRRARRDAARPADNSCNGVETESILSIRNHLRMKRTLQFALMLVVAGTALPAFAQRAGRAVHNSEFRIMSAPEGTRVLTPAQAQQAGLISTGASRGIVSASGDGATVRTLLEGNFPVPGLGFDYPHLAAINRNLETRALIDPVTQQRLALARQIRRETPAGTVIPFFPMAPQVIVVQSPPPVIVLQQSEGNAGDTLAMRAERVSASPREPEAAAEAPVLRAVEPHRVLEEFILVRKDGQEIFAVAFSAQDGLLIYITREGVRRSLALADVDREATTLRNDERGADVKLPI